MEGIELQIEQKPGHSATLWSEVCPGSESIFGIGNFNCNLWIPAKIKGRYEILFEFMLRGHRIDKTTTLYWKVLFYFFFTPAWNGKRGEGGGGGKKCPPVKLKKEKSMFERKYLSHFGYDHHVVHCMVYATYYPNFFIGGIFPLPPPPHSGLNQGVRLSYYNFQISPRTPCTISTDCFAETPVTVSFDHILCTFWSINMRRFLHQMTNH